MKIFKYFYSHKGPVLDYQNKDIVDCFFKGLNKYLKKHRTLFVLVDPYVLEAVRNADGDILRSFDNTELITQLNKLGYKHQGYSVGYSQKSQIRWLSVLDVEGKGEQEVLKEMDYQTRRNIKRAQEMNVETKTLDLKKIHMNFLKKRKKCILSIQC